MPPKKTTEDKYIEETIDAVENVGRFSHLNSKYYCKIISELKLNINM